MPEIEGMELARLLRRFADPPAVVFLTGHADAAVEAFEVQALDFLIKPVSRDRLDAALRADRRSRARAAALRGGEAPRRAAPRPDVVAVDNPKGGGKRLVRLETIQVAQANGDYARIDCDDGASCCARRSASSRRTGARLGFARVHRAWLVNLAHAVELRAQPNGTAVLVLRDGDRDPGRAAQRRRAAPPAQRLSRRRRRARRRAARAQRRPRASTRPSTSSAAKASSIARSGTALAITTPATAPGIGEHADRHGPRAARTLP